MGFHRRKLERQKRGEEQKKKLEREARILAKRMVIFLGSPICSGGVMYNTMEYSYQFS